MTWKKVLQFGQELFWTSIVRLLIVAAAIVLAGIALLLLVAYLASKTTTGAP